jgi:hypothetical protein
MGGLGQLFCFPRKIVEFPIHFCLVYIVAINEFCYQFKFMYLFLRHVVYIYINIIVAGLNTLIFIKAV